MTITNERLQEMRDHDSAIPEADYYEVLNELIQRRAEDRDEIINAGLSWIAARELAGQLAHSEWQAMMIEQGYADHEPHRNSAAYDECSFSMNKHHSDMVPWAQLSNLKRPKYYRLAHVGFLLGHGVRFPTSHPDTDTVTAELDEK